MKIAAGVAGMAGVVALGLGLVGGACGSQSASRCGDTTAQTKCVAEQAGSGSSGGEPFAVEIGQICVARSGVGADGLGTVDVMVTPKGCLSSALEKVEVACAVTAGEGGVLSVTGTFRYRSGEHGSSLPDCSGGGHATCGVGGLTPGPVTIAAGDLRLPVEVPMPPRGDGPVPAPGDCVGSQF